MKLKALIRYLVKGSRYDEEVREHGNTLMAESIYSSPEMRLDFAKRQNRVHTWFKHVFFIPALNLGEKILGKYLVKQIPDKPWYKNLKILDVAFENTMVDWCDIAPAQGEKLTEQRLSGQPVRVMNLLKHFLYTICLNDTAYFEATNMLMFHIAKEMNKAYADEKGFPKHLIYLGPSIMDVRYFAFVEQNVLKQIIPTNYPRKTLSTANETSTIKAKS